MMELWEKIKNHEIVQKVGGFFNKYTNIKPITDALQSAKTIQKVISIVLRVFSVLLGIGLLVVWILNWRFINQFNFFGGLGYLIWQVVFLYAGIIITKIFYQRSLEIVDLPESDYVITPILAVMMVTVGEAVFMFLALMSVPAMLTVWFGGRALFHGASSIGFMLSALNLFSPGNIFLAGISVFVSCWVVGFLTLVFLRLITETVLAVVSIAKDASILRVHATQKKK
ncbi:MAG: hypothetical protein ACK2TT_03110 [Anaerolineales bacterium]|jgi:hypothetical protein